MRLSVITGLLLTFLLACNPKANKEEALAKIEEAEQALDQNQSSDQHETLAKNAIEAYESFAQDFPDDSLSGKYLYKAAEINRSINEEDNAVNDYIKVLKDHPGYKNASSAMFWLFVLESDNLDKVKPVYEAYAKDHPKDKNAAFFVELTNKPLEEAGLDLINWSEKMLYPETETFQFDEDEARMVITGYEWYVKHYPQSAQAPDILFKAADLYRVLKQYEKALSLYRTIENKYPDYEKVPHAIFLQGFVYENELFQLGKAKERYETFLEKYPDHELADDVEFSLKNLGKSPEEIIEQFEQPDSAL